MSAPDTTPATERAEWQPSPETDAQLNDAFQWDHGHNWVTREWVESLLAREYERGRRDGSAS